MHIDAPSRVRLPLTLIMAAAVGIGVALAAMVAYVELAPTVRSAQVAAMQTEAERLTSLTALALRGPVWQMLPEQVESIMDAAFVNPDVVSMVVEDTHGVRLFFRQRSDDATLTPGIRVSRDVVRDGKPIARLHLTMSTASVDRIMNRFRGRFTRAAFVSTAAALLMITLVLYLAFIRPMKRLVDAAGQLAEGRWNSPISGANTSEIDRLALGLEATRRSLLKLFSEVDDRNCQLAEINAGLEKRVAERTRSLEHALEELKMAQEEIVQREKLASLGRIVAGVAHELNTPIGTAMTAATTVQESLARLQGEVAGGAVRRSTLDGGLQHMAVGLTLFVRNLERASKLVSDFKQVALDQATDQCRRCDLAQVTREVLATLAPTVNSAGCELRSTLAQSIVCESYPGAYGQVLNNLVLNAVTHGYPDGYGGVIEVKLESNGETIQLTVSDHGAGMPEDVRTRVFDPFFTTRLGGGTGLGMYVSQAIVARTLEGTVRIRSAPGQGTEVTVSFPLRTPPD